jgi:iron complex transport system substrate-binding protein
MTRPRPVPLLFLFGMLLLAGCRTTPDAAPPATPVTDDLGRTVRIPAAVARVVTLAPNLTELVFAAGAGPRLVGVTTADDYPPAVDTLAHVGALPLDFEAIAALDPDLVLANDDINNPNDAATFDALGIPLYFFSFQDLDDIFTGIRTLGDLLGTASHAQAMADALEASVDAVRRRTETVEAPPLTLFIIDDETLFSFGTESYMHEVIALAGGRSATASLETVRPVLSDEFVLNTKPDVIFGSFGEAYDPARLLELHPTWDIVPAIRHGRVYGVDPDYFLRPTPRLLEGIGRMARHLHPALFAAPEAPAAPPETP